jgi:hypothetical protein
MGVVMKEITAFPFVASDDTGMIINTGMTMRDYFAAKAMQGFMGSSWNVKSFEEMASKAYQLSDAMLKARDA